MSHEEIYDEYIKNGTKEQILDALRIVAVHAFLAAKEINKDEFKFEYKCVTDYLKSINGKKME